MLLVKKFIKTKDFKFFLLCLIINIIIFFAFYTIYHGRNWTVYNDSGDYVGIAQNIIKNGQYGFNLAMPDGSRTPVYPLFVALFGANIGLVVFVQHILSAFVGLMVFKIGKNLFTQRSGWWAGLFFATEPSVIVWTNQALTEPLFTFLLVSAIYLFILGLEKKHNLLFSSLLFGLMVLTRPIGLLLIIPIMVFLFIWKKFNYIAFKIIVLFFLIFLAVLFPWYLRNKITFDVWTLDTMSSIVLNDEAQKVLNIHKDEESAKVLNEKYPNMIREEIDRDGFKGVSTRNPNIAMYYKKQAKAIIMTYPLTFITLHLSGVPGILFKHNYDYYGQILARSLGNLNFGAIYTPLRLIGSIIWYLIPILAFFGFIYRLREGDGKIRLKVIFLFGIIIYFILITGHGGNDRFRYPISPILLLFAFFGLFSGFNILKKKLYKYV